MYINNLMSAVRGLSSVAHCFLKCLLSLTRLFLPDLRKNFHHIQARNGCGEERIAKSNQLLIGLTHTHTPQTRSFTATSILLSQLILKDYIPVPCVQFFVIILLFFNDLGVAVIRHLGPGELNGISHSMRALQSCLRKTPPPKLTLSSTHLHLKKARCTHDCKD